jgi:uncharacterized protein
VSAAPTAGPSQAWTGPALHAWAVFCRDRTGSEALRATHLAAHLAHIEQIMDHILVAGPMRAPGSAIDSPVTGSLLVFRTDSIEETRRFMADDPYTTEGIWEIEAIRPFHALVGTWIGGKSW